MKKFLYPILFIVSLIIASNAGMIYQVYAATLPQGSAVFQTSLLTAISASDVSMTLVANSLRGGSVLSGFNCVTMDEGSASAEYVCGTISGTAVTAMVRGIDPQTGTSSVASLKFAHRRGALIKITDFPLLQILRNQINGSETIVNLIQYAVGTNCSGASANTAICPKAYMDALAVGSAVSANETTQGFVQGATALQQASSTAIGSTGSFLFVQAKYASSSPVVGCAVGYTAIVGAGCVPVAGLDGKINPNYIATSSAYNWSGTHTFSGAVTTNSSTTFNGTTTISAVNYTGQFISILASTSINTSTGPIPVFIATSTGALAISQANVATTTDFLGFATSTNVLNGATGTVQISGIVSGFSGLTAGRSYYVQDTRGTIGTTIGSAELYVGIAYSATQILLDRKDDAWQYLGASGFTSGGAYGAATHADTATVPSNVRYVVVTGNFPNNKGGTAYLHGTYFKVGATTGSQGSCSGTVGVPGYATVAWSGSTITITETASCAAATVSSSAYTAYFYR